VLNTRTTAADTGGGHIGTFVGGKAQKILAPSIVKWLTTKKR
jgi:hypothetical protein